jgi:hypothetical protein
LVHGNFGDVRKDIVLSAHIMNVLVHFDLKNFRLLKRQITIAEKFALKHKFPEKEVKAFFKLLEKATAAEKINMVSAQPILSKTGEFDFVDEDFIGWWLKKRAEA